MKQVERPSRPIDWFTPQMHTTTRPWAAQSQEGFEFSTWLAGNQIAEPLPAASPGAHSQGAGSGGKTELNPKLSGVEWDYSVNLCTTMPKAHTGTWYFDMFWHTKGLFANSLFHWAKLHALLITGIHEGWWGATFLSSAAVGAVTRTYKCLPCSYIVV